MKIGVDVSQAVYGTGVSVYTKNLVEHLLEIDHENEYVLYGGSLRRLGELKQRFPEDREKLRRRFYRMPPTVADVVWNRWHVGRMEWLTGRLDVFHSSDWTQPPTRAFKVTTVHDLAPLKLPKYTGPKVLSAHKRRLSWVKREVDRIIVPSKSTREDLVELGFEEGRIRVIYEAVEEIYGKRSEREVEEVRRKYRLGEDYLLMVGTAGRKNVRRIVRAFEKIRKKEQQLVFTGERPDDAEETRGVRFLGYVKDEELVRLYNGAKLLVYATLYEGFGLPVLQAMACECPVVTSNISSMPEIAGDAAVLVDPKNEDEIAEGVKKALANRRKLIEKGEKRVREFSWERMARETLEVYKEVLK